MVKHVSRNGTGVHMFKFVMYEQFLSVAVLIYTLHSNVCVLCYFIISPILGIISVSNVSHADGLSHFSL
jgi:hypothetical protein